MAEQSTQATRKQYGPFNLIGKNGLDPSQFLSLGWEKVCGSTVVVSIADNFASQAIVASWRAWAIAEIAIDGVNGGFVSRLKTQQLRMQTGPLTIVFPWEQAFDEIRFLGRPMIGGIPQAITTLPATATLTAQVFITPRGGFNIRG